MTKSILLATALFFASAVGASYAQTGTTTTTTVAPAQPKAPMPAPVPTPAEAPSPAAPQAPGTTTTTTTTTTVPEAVTGACRTRKTAGDPCSCLKAPTTMGVSTASTTGGRNMCVIP